jgi:uncharacterized OB-fold protein
MAEISVSDASPYWKAFANDELRLPTCVECGLAHMPPGPICPFCYSEALEWRKASGKATLSTWVVERRSWYSAFVPPYAVGQVELQEGPRIVVSLPLDEVDSLKSGLIGKVDFHEAPSGRRLPIFRIGK